MICSGLMNKGSLFYLHPRNRIPQCIPFVAYFTANLCRASLVMAQSVSVTIGGGGVGGSLFLPRRPMLPRSHSGFSWVCQTLFRFASTLETNIYSYICIHTLRKRIFSAYILAREADNFFFFLLITIYLPGPFYLSLTHVHSFTL